MSGIKSAVESIKRDDWTWKKSTLLLTTPQYDYDIYQSLQSTASSTGGQISDLNLPSFLVSNFVGTPIFNDDGSLNYHSPAWWPDKKNWWAHKNLIDPKVKNFLYFNKINQANKEVRDLVSKIGLLKKLYKSPLPANFKIIISVVAEGEELQLAREKLLLHFAFWQKFQVVICTK